jgi:hypothetical protein
MLTSWSGDDDYFSSDLPKEAMRNTFGRVDKPILIVPCAQDELVPPVINREQLLARWIESCPLGMASEFSGLIPGADHAVSQPQAQSWLSNVVVKFLETLE